VNAVLREFVSTIKRFLASGGRKNFEVQYVMRLRFIKDTPAGVVWKIVVVEMCEAIDGTRSLRFRRHPSDVSEKELKHHLLWKSTIGPWLNGKDLDFIPKRKQG
jgi:hypothetical protein